MKLIATLLCIVIAVMATLYARKPAPSPVASPPQVGLIYAAGIIEGGGRVVQLQFEIPGRLLGPIAAEGHRAKRDEVLACIDARVTGPELERTLLRAPADCTVLRVLLEPGELVGPGQTVLAVADCSVLRVRAQVEELDVMNVRLSQLATVTADGLPNLVLSGRVVQYAAALSAKTDYRNQPAERMDVRVLEVLIELDGSCDLPIGLPVDVLIAKGD